VTLRWVRDKDRFFVVGDTLTAEVKKAESGWYYNVNSHDNKYGTVHYHQGGFASKDDAMRAAEAYVC
jgi:exosome complex RNA-binding protein Rrp4